MMKVLKTSPRSEMGIRAKSEVLLGRNRSSRGRTMTPGTQRGAERAPEHRQLQTSRERRPGWGTKAGPWARGAPTSGRQQREAAEQQQQQRDEARRRGALHGAGGRGRRTKARRAAAARSGRAWAANARILRASFNYPARRRRGGGVARGDPPSSTASPGHAATQPLLQGHTRGTKL